MTDLRLILGALTTVASLGLTGAATCGPRPALQPLSVPKLDGGEVDAGAPVDRCKRCDSWGPIELQGPLPHALVELSGLARSLEVPKLLYAHNDSGDTPRIFAIADNGVELAELRLVGATAKDWEDIAVGPCEGGGNCLFVADTGDNLKKRTEYVVYRSREPNLRPLFDSPRGHPVEMNLTFDRLVFVYPNETSRNAETLLSHPVTGDLYVITKERAGTMSRVFKFPRPFQPNERVTLIDLGGISAPQSDDSSLTGGDIHPCGDSVLLRMYNRIVKLDALPDAGFESAFGALPVELPSAVDEASGEAITWGSDGRSYFSASEGNNQLLHRVGCRE